MEDAGPVAKPVSYPERWSKPRGQFGIQFLQPSEVSFIGGGDRLYLGFQVCRKRAESFLNRSKRTTGMSPSNGQLTQNDMHRLIVVTVEAFRAEMAEIAAESEIPF